MGLKERQYSVVEGVSSSDRRFLIVELAEGHLGIGVDEGLLVDSTNAFQGADVERVLRPKIARVCGFNLPVGNIIVLLPL